MSIISPMTAVVRICVVLAAAIVLSGCPGEFSYSGSLAQVRQAAHPLAEGVYVGVPKDEEEANGRVQLLGYKNDQYGLLSLEDPSIQTLRFFGPIGETYIVEVVAAEGGYASSSTYKAYLMKVEADGTVLLATPSANAYMAEVFYDWLGMLPQEKAGLERLTNDPALNWAILQELILRHGAQIQFAPEYQPQGR